MNSKQWSRIADFGLSDLYIPFNARGLKTKQFIPPPPPPEASAELLAARAEQEQREAALAKQEEDRLKRQQGEAQAKFAAGESERLQGQFRATRRAKPGRSQSGLRL